MISFFYKGKKELKLELGMSMRKWVSEIECQPFVEL